MLPSHCRRRGGGEKCRQSETETDKRGTHTERDRDRWVTERDWAVSTVPEDRLMQVTMTGAFWQGDRGLDGLWGGMVQPVLALEWFLGDSTPAKEAANFEDKSGAWRLSAVAKLSLYHLQAVCHWVISKPH